MSSNDVWTISKVLKSSVDFLKAKKINSARLDAELLISNALSCDRISLYTNFDKPLSELEKVRLRGDLKRRSEGEPVAHILGFSHFFGRKFLTDNRALIPRSDSECLIEKAMEFTRDQKGPLKILDLGAGTGCLGITLALELPNASVDLVEKDTDACDVASKNVVHHDVSERVKVHEKCMFDWIASEDQHYDIVISNPPYIRTDDKENLQEEVFRYEPHLALFAEKHGLQFYEDFSKKLSKLIKPDGILVLEIGFDQGDDVVSLFNEADHWSDVSLFKDYGKNDRVVTASLSRA